MVRRVTSEPGQQTRRGRPFRKHLMQLRQLIASLALLVSWAAPLAAQRAYPQIREGFWVGAGFGIAAATAHSEACTACPATSDFGMSGLLRAGGSIGWSLLAGAEGIGWSRNADGVEERVGFLSAVLHAYPSLEGGLWVKGGAGIARYVGEDGTNSVTSTGPGVTVGVGYDLRVARSVSLTPYFNYARQLGARTVVNGESMPEGTDIELMQVGLGLTWH